LGHKILSMQFRKPLVETNDTGESPDTFNSNHYKTKLPESSFSTRQSETFNANLFKQFLPELNHTVATRPLRKRPTLRAASRAPCRSRLPTAECSPVPPSQTLGVLCFPLSPPSRKGATQEPEKSLASQLASTAELPLKNTAEIHPTPHKKIRQPQFGSVTLR
jgi:hypothetical protein